MEKGMKIDYRIYKSEVLRSIETLDTGMSKVIVYSNKKIKKLQEELQDRFEFKKTWRR